jgi:hypothetical protein
VVLGLQRLKSEAPGWLVRGIGGHASMVPKSGLRSDCRLARARDRIVGVPGIREGSSTPGNAVRAFPADRQSTGNVACGSHRRQDCNKGGRGTIKEATSCRAGNELLGRMSPRGLSLILKPLGLIHTRQGFSLNLQGLIPRRERLGPNAVGCELWRQGLKLKTLGSRPRWTRLSFHTARFDLQAAEVDSCVHEADPQAAGFDRWAEEVDA